MKMKKMSSEEKKKLYKRIDEKTKVISHPSSTFETISFIVNGVPPALFEEWRKECNDFFNDIYWAKMWTDHVKARAYDVLVSSSVQKAEHIENEKQDNEEVFTFGDGGIENG